MNIGFAYGGDKFKEISAFGERIVPAPGQTGDFCVLMDPIVYVALSDCVRQPGVYLYFFVYSY